MWCRDNENCCACVNENAPAALICLNENVPLTDVSSLRDENGQVVAGGIILEGDVEVGSSGIDDALPVWNNLMMELDDSQVAMLIAKTLRMRRGLWDKVKLKGREMEAIETLEREGPKDLERQIVAISIPSSDQDSALPTFAVSANEKNRTTTFGSEEKMDLVTSASSAIASTEPGTGKKDKRPTFIRRSECHGQIDIELILQFNCETYFCAEAEEEAKVEIVRFGPSDKECSCRWETRDLTAKAGVRYQKSYGTVHFAAGELIKEVSIPIISNDSFDATVEFQVLLDSPENATLGRYLDRCYVKIIDDDFFPTNRFSEDIQAENYDGIPEGLLLLEYFKMNMHNRTVRSGTFRMVLGEQCDNLYFIWRLMLMQYLIDQVVNPDTQDEDMLVVKNKEGELTTITICIIAPLIVLHLFDYTKLKWKVAGESRKLLQTNLLRKFMNYTEESRNHVNTSELIMAMTRDCADLVSDGYTSIIPLMKNLGKMLLILVYQIVDSIVRGKPFNFLVIGGLFVFPLLMFIFLFFRNDKTQAAGHAQNVKQNALVQDVDQIVDKFRLIADYGRKRSFVDTFQTKIKSLNQAITKTLSIRTNNKYFATWLSIIVVALYTLIGGLQILSGDLQLGAYIVNLQIFAAIGASWGDVYSVVLQMQSSFPALLHVVFFMNLAVDFPVEMSLSRWRRAMSNQAMTRMSQPGSDSQFDHHGYSIDLLPIDIVDLQFKHPLVGNHAAEIAGNFKIPQGTFSMLVGSFGNGKTTLLRLVGGVLVPDEGLFVPPHLRILHISDNPLFFHGSLSQNLIMGVGNAFKEEDAKLDRVLSICRMLKIPEHILHFLQHEQTSSAGLRASFTLSAVQDIEKSAKHGQEGSVVGKRRSSVLEEEKISNFENPNWEEVLSMTEKTLMNIARAFIANPNILCLHRPTMRLDADASMNLYRLLRTMVDEKGLELDSDRRVWATRRPTTVIITQTRKEGFEFVDDVYTVDGKGVTGADRELALQSAERNQDRR